MEEVVNEAMVIEHTDDPTLRQLIEIVLVEIGEDRHYFDMQHEPILYRRFRAMVREGLKAAVALNPPTTTP
jgi:hypothetical protein